MPNLQRLAQRSHRLWHAVFFGLVLALLFIALRGLGPVLVPVAAALILAYLLDPLVTHLNRRLRLPRAAGTAVLFVAGLLFIAALLVLVVPAMVREVRAFAEAFPGYLARVRANLVPWVEQTAGVSVPRTFDALVQGFGADVKTVMKELIAPLGGMAGKVARSAADVVSALGTIFLVPVFTFYFLPRFHDITAAGFDLIPRRYQPWVRDTAAEIDVALAAWIRGQLTVMALLAALYAAGLSIAGVKMAIFIGSLTGVLAIVPYVGVAIGFSLSLLVALLEGQGWGPVVGVLVTFGVVQGLEGLVLTPLLVGEKVGLGPVGVLIALILGGTLFGFVGVLIAVPTAAALLLAAAAGGCGLLGGGGAPEGGARAAGGEEAGFFQLPRLRWPGFGGGEELRGDPSFGVEVVEAPEIRAFFERAARFYSLLTLRRFNSHATFRDPKLREFFRSEQAFSDYYADLAQDLAEAHFEQRRPVYTEVVDVALEAPGVAVVTVVIRGDNGQPLRWWDTVLERRDRWERIDGAWWLVPGKV